MMSSDYKTDDPDVNISGQNPKFFKIILQDTIAEGRLAIPKKFVKDHGDCLSSGVILKVPDGTTWKMELVKGGIYEAWLENGWEEFSDFYSLKHAHLLVFQYGGNSTFLVFIFDTTLSEIHYPRKPINNPNLEQNPNQLNGFIENIEDSDCQKLEFEGNCNESKGRRISQALEAAGKFTSRYPWFKVVVESKKSQGREPSVALNVPMGFVRDHTTGYTHTVILKVEGSKYFWPSKLVVFWRKFYAQLTSGWAAFVRDNSLKVGDVCVFELVATKTLKNSCSRNNYASAVKDICGCLAKIEAL